MSVGILDFGKFKVFEVDVGEPILHKSIRFYLMGDVADFPFELGHCIGEVIDAGVQLGADVFEEGD